jgi:hypothetical protein
MPGWVIKNTTVQEKEAILLFVRALDWYIPFSVPDTNDLMLIDIDRGPRKDGIRCMGLYNQFIRSKEGLKEFQVEEISFDNLVTELRKLIIKQDDYYRKSMGTE